MVSNSRPTREDYYRALSDNLPEETLVVTSLGNASYLWATVRDAPENFYLEDAMGLALPLALGLAVAQPNREVVVVEGDGGLLMHMGGLVTVGAVAPNNLTILLIQNGVHAASGGQALTNAELDIADIARAMGLKHAENITSVKEFQSGLVPAFYGSRRRAALRIDLLRRRNAIRVRLAVAPADPNDASGCIGVDQTKRLNTTKRPYPGNT